SRRRATSDRATYTGRTRRGDLPMACDPEMLRDVELFEHLGEDDRIRLAEAVDLRRLGPGEVLFHAGEPGEALYIVRSGEVELFVRDHAGQKIPLAIACTNQIFGELA